MYCKLLTKYANYLKKALMKNRKFVNKLYTSPLTSDVIRSVSVSKLRARPSFGVFGLYIEDCGVNCAGNFIVGPIIIIVFYSYMKAQHHVNSST